MPRESRFLAASRTELGMKCLADLEVMLQIRSSMSLVASNALLHQHSHHLVELTEICYISACQTAYSSHGGHGGDSLAY